MRSDWTEGATYALFRCGRYGEIDGAWGRNNADNLHFIINKRGILAADTGAVHSLNNAALAFAGSQVRSEGLSHIREYARQTIAHNSITVGSEPLELRDWRDALLGAVRGGGQSPIQDDSWWKLWGLSKPKAGDRPFGAKSYEVTFATAGPTGGHIRISQNGAILLDRPLATDVEDNYQKWSEDPRYRGWITRPECRNFIGAG